MDNSLESFNITEFSSVTAVVHIGLPISYMQFIDKRQVL